MRTYAASEGIGLDGAHSILYSIPIFSKEAIIRWIGAKRSNGVSNYSESEPRRFFRVHTLSMMTYGKKQNS